MSSKTKGTERRPTDNFGYFTGLGYKFWREKASGRTPQLKRGRDGTRIEYVLDEADGLPLNSGGIRNPQDVKLGIDSNYYRFFSAESFAKYGKDGYLGYWWLDAETMLTLMREAEDTRNPLSKIAARRLAIPAKWNDMRHIVRARPAIPLKAWFGKGKVAHPDHSPIEGRPLRDGQLTGDAPHLALPQYFVPGDLKPAATSGKPPFSFFFKRAGWSRVDDRNLQRNLFPNLRKGENYIESTRDIQGA